MKVCVVLSYDEHEDDPYVEEVFAEEAREYAQALAEALDGYVEEHELRNEPVPTAILYTHEGAVRIDWMHFVLDPEKQTHVLEEVTGRVKWEHEHSRVFRIDREEHKPVEAWVEESLGVGEETDYRIRCMSPGIQITVRGTDRDLVNETYARKVEEAHRRLNDPANFDALEKFAVGVNFGDDAARISGYQTRAGGFPITEGAELLRVKEV